MAYPHLAVGADLTARGIDVGSAQDTLLAAASAAIRAAAGGAPITLTTSTITLTTEASRRLELPVRPIHAVTAVRIDGQTITDWVLRGQSLWREAWWQAPQSIPSLVDVTVEYGWHEIPPDLVDLVCSLVAAGGASIADSGYDPRRQMSYERIDDYQYGLRTGDDEVISVMELPARTVRMIRERFGTAGSVVVGSVR